MKTVEGRKRTRSGKGGKCQGKGKIEASNVGIQLKWWSSREKGEKGK